MASHSESGVVPCGETGAGAVRESCRAVKPVRGRSLSPERDREALCGF